VVAGFCVIIRTLYKQVSELQEKRIADAQSYTTKLLELVESQHTENRQLVDALNGCSEALGEQRMLVESVLADRGINPRPTRKTRG
jgi:hypothetical protein